MNDLRRRFEELREEERTSVPRFAIPSPRQPNRRPLLALAVLLLVVIALLFPRHSETFTPADRAAARSIAEWHAPTDFLLRTPGRELLTSVPSIPSKGVSR
jgi:hypothetical protein